MVNGDAVSRPLCPRRQGSAGSPLCIVIVAPGAPQTLIIHPSAYALPHTVIPREGTPQLGPFEELSGEELITKGLLYLLVSGVLIR